MTSASLACKFITLRIRQKGVKLGLGLFCFGIIGGCGDRVNEHGHTINSAQLATIEIGRTKRADILAVLGGPSFEGAFDSQKLYYVSQVMEAPVAGINTTKSRTIYIFTFDNNNLLKSIDLTDEKSGTNVSYIDEKTPTPGNKFGVIEQIFSNLRRRQVED